VGCRDGPTYHGRVRDIYCSLNASGKRHNLRLLNGKWVCSGGRREQGRLGCDFTTPEYHEAVTHATVHRSTPPDMPKGTWA
jgi:hypothetical protein